MAESTERPGRTVPGRTVPGRTVAAAMAGVASVLVVGLAGCGAGSGGPGASPERNQVATPAPMSPTRAPGSGSTPTPAPAPTGTSGSTYVFNTFGEEQGFADRMPKRLVVSEFTTFSSLRWTGWANDAAAGKGQVRGTWCLPDCSDRGYPAELRLIDPRPYDGKRFFTRYTVEADLPAKYQQAFEDAEADGSLMTPE